MGNFWASKLAPAAPAPVAAPAAQGGVPAAWWQGPTGVPQTTVGIPQALVNTPTPEYSTTKAQSARLNDRCPGCYSGNYFATPGRTMKRCYDCGYPVIQQFTGAGTPSGMGGGEVTGSARQLSSNHVLSTQDGTMALGNHTAISSASEAIGHA